MTWKELEHTADMGLRIEAPDIESLAEECRRALYSYIPRRAANRILGHDCWTCRLEGLDLEDLHIRWLNELIYLWDSKRSLLTPAYLSIDIEHTRLTVEGLLSTGTGGTCPFKAATYGGASLETGPPAVLTVYFDV